MDLTWEQTNVARHVWGHAKVSAVAGSGKTATMVAYVYQAARSGVPPSRIAVMMFNREAAKDFRRRMNEMFLGGSRRAPEVRTFHSVGLKLCRRFEELGYLPRCRVSENSRDRTILADKALKKASNNLRHHSNVDLKDLVEEFGHFIDRVKGDVRSPEIIIEESDISPQWYQLFIEGFMTYERLRKNKHLRFFEDMIWEPVICMKDNDDARRIVENHMDVVVVDEAQDLNVAQQRLVECIAGNRARVTVVGDVDQTIYAWRGAYPQYLLEEFERQYRPSTRYKLSHTFRYGHRLSLMANHLIRHNREREDIFCVSHEGCPDTRVDLLFDGYENGKSTVQQIVDRWIEEGHALEDLAILVRDNAAAVGLMLDLLSRDTPFCLKGAMRFFGNEPYIDALLGVIELISETLWRTEAIDRITNLLHFPYSSIKKEYWRKVASRCLEKKDILSALDDQKVRHLPEYQYQRLAHRLKWIARHSSNRAEKRSLVQSDQPGTEVRKLLQEYTGPSVADYQSAFGWMSTTKTAYDEYTTTLNEYLKFVERINMPVTGLIEHLDGYAIRAKEQRHGIAITTCHGAKGLEYEGVIVYGLRQGQFPHKRSLLEDERRLFYVAITRAKKHLFLVAPNDRELKQFIAGGSRRNPAGTGIASQFLYEITYSMSNEIGGAIHLNDKQKIRQYKDVDDDTVVNRYLESVFGDDTPVVGRKSNVIQGPFEHEGNSRPVNIYHNTFGKGEIVKWRGERYMYVVFESGKEGWFREPDTYYERLD